MLPQPLVSVAYPRCANLLGVHLTLPVGVDVHRHGPLEAFADAAVQLGAIRLTLQLGKPLIVCGNKHVLLPWRRVPKSQHDETESFDELVQGMRFEYPQEMFKSASSV